MKLRAKDFFKLGQEMETPGKPIQTAPVLEKEEEIDEENIMAPSRSKLENDYKSYSSADIDSLSYGDRLRVSDTKGNLRDVILQPDGKIAVQDLTLRVQYGITQVFSDWDEAQKNIGNYSVERGIKV